MKTATFLRQEELVPGIWQAFFRPQERLDFLPGQYVDLHLPQVVGDPRGPRRTFTLTSLPSEPAISFIYRTDEILSPYKQVLQALAAGDEVGLGDSLGDLVLPKLASVPLIFVAGGIGMASFTSMLKQLFQSSEQRHIDLFYRLRSAQDDAFRDQLDDFPFASKHVFIKPQRLTAETIVSVVGEDSLIYLSGSESFVLGLRDALRAHGVDPSRLVFDYYDGYAEL